MLTSNKNIVIISLLLLFAVIAAYSNHFNNGFHFDDSHTVVDNVHIRDIKNIPSYYSDPKMFSSDPLHWGLRPLVTTTLAIDYKLGGGLNPFYFQLSTFIWFVFLCVLLYFTYKNLLERSIQHQWVSYIALGITAWYALHTANAETVNYIIARSDVLSTFFIVTSFLIYIAYPAKRKWFLYIIPAFIGVFAKETVLVLVIVLFFYIILFELELSIAGIFKVKNLKAVFNTIFKLLPLFAIVAVTQWYTISKVTAIPNVTSPLFYYLLTQSYVWLHYVIMYFLPVGLTADSDWTVITNIADDRILIGLLFIVILVTTIFKTSAKKETRPIAFGLIWFAAALLPTSVVPFSEVTNDHRMLFAFVGLALSVGTFIGLWLIKMEKQLMQNTAFKVLTGTCMLLILGLNAYGVHERNKVWKDEESLWYNVTIKSPLNGRGLMNYGLVQMNKGNYDAANTYFTRALVYLPYYNTLYINLGVLNGALNKPDIAEENFKKAIQYGSGVSDCYSFYARWLSQVNRINDAIPMAQKALQINPYSVMALNVLLDAYDKLGLWDKLNETAVAALAVLPNDMGFKTYLQAAKARASVVTLSAPAAKPTTATDYLNLSLTYYNQQNYVKCIEACQNALKLKPDYADAYSNMGAAYNMLQEWAKGADACEKALKINPDHKLAKGNLNWAKSQLSPKK